MSEQLSPEQVSDKNVHLRTELELADSQAEEQGDMADRYEGSAVQENYQETLHEVALIDAEAKQFYEEHKDTLHEEANEENTARTNTIVDKSARLYKKENSEVDSVARYTAAHAAKVDSPSEAFLIHQESAVYEHEAAVEDSDRFAKANINILHEAANKVAESMEKET